MVQWSLSPSPTLSTDTFPSSSGLHQHIQLDVLSAIKSPSIQVCHELKWTNSLQTVWQLLLPSESKVCWATGVLQHSDSSWKSGTAGSSRKWKWGTKPFQWKNMSMTFIMECLSCTFFQLGQDGFFHCSDWCSLSLSHLITNRSFHILLSVYFLNMVPYNWHSMIILHAYNSVM